MYEYASEIELGAEYTDKITGFTGTATQVTFHLENAQQAVLLECGDGKGGMLQQWFYVERVLS